MRTRRKENTTHRPWMRSIYVCHLFHDYAHLEVQRESRKLRDFKVISESHYHPRQRHVMLDWDHVIEIVWSRGDDLREHPTVKQIM